MALRLSVAETAFYFQEDACSLHALTFNQGELLSDGYVTCVVGSTVYTNRPYTMDKIE